MKVRLNLYIDQDVAAQLSVMACRPGGNKSRIVSHLLKKALEHEASAALGDMLKPRLDAMSRDILAGNRIDNVLLEALMLFVRHVLAVLPPSAPGDAVAAAAGGKRFDAFIEELGRELASKGVLPNIQPAGRRPR